jgi:choline dehydrogenase-like flavoprotein
MSAETSTSTGGIVHGRSLAAGLDETCDVVVIGSGAGGAVMAAHLAEAGLSVIVLEEGPYYKPEEIASFRPTQTMRRMWREAGLFAALPRGNTPVIALAMGRNVGGSSVHTGGVCFRVPGNVHDHWVRELGLPELAERRFETAYADVERRVHVTEVPVSARSLSTTTLLRGAEKLGVGFDALRRNTVACEGNARCNFGCPKHTKMSVDLAYLPSAVRHGTRVFSDSLVERILFRGDRAVGVEGRILGRPDAPKLRVRARAVVLACGTVHTPLLLEKSGVQNVHVGRHITLHPSLRVSAVFDQRIDGWNGAMQSVYSDHFAAEGITFVGVYTPVNLLAAALPGVGPALRVRARNMGHLAVMGGLIHDEGGGVIAPTPLREGAFSYEMIPRDLARLRRAATLLGEVAFAAGAKEVYLPIFGVPPVRSLATLRALEREPIDPRRIESVAFHPLGSARMANDPRRGVVDPAGRVYGRRSLYVADGSVFPTSIGVNSQVAIMAMATRLAFAAREEIARGPGLALDK